MMAGEGRLAQLPRRWLAIGVPERLDVGYETYGAVRLEAMPPVGRRLDGTLDWLAAEPTLDRSLERHPDDPVGREANVVELAALLGDRPIALPPAFVRSIGVEDDDARPIEVVWTSQRLGHGRALTSGLLASEQGDTGDECPGDCGSDCRPFGNSTRPGAASPSSLPSPC